METQTKEQNELPQDDEKTQRSYISHFVGNLSLVAVFRTSGGESAEDLRVQLVTKIKEKTSGHIVNNVVSLIERSDWSTKQGVDSFKAEYEKLKNETLSEEELNKIRQN